MNFPNNVPWLWLVIALLALAPLAWFAWKHKVETSNGYRFVGFLLRLFGIALIIFALTNPQRIRERPTTGENIVAVLADNSLGMSVPDSNSDQSRGEMMRTTLNGTDGSSTWLANLEETYQIRNYRFGSSLQRISDFDTLDFSDEASGLNSSLVSAQQRLSSTPLAAMLVFSDGVATDSPLDEAQLSSLPPIFPVVVGSARPLPDLAIRSLDVSQSAFGDSPVQLSSRFEISGLDAKEIVARVERLSLDGDGGLGGGSPLIEEKEFEANGAAKVSLDWIPQEGGIQFYKYSATPVASEVGTDSVEKVLFNNERLFVADRGKQTYRILYITGRPNWEYKFLNRALSNDPQLSMVGLIRVASREPKFEFKGRAGENSNTLYRGFGREDENERYDESVLIRMNTKDEYELRTGFPDTAETLFGYDAIIIDDLEADFFTFNQQTLIRDFVKQRGGGLLVLGGVNSLEDGGYRNSPIAEALPVYIDGTSRPIAGERAVQWSLTREGWVEPWTRIRQLETDEKMRLQGMPLLKVYNTLDRIKPGSTTLAELTDSANESYPALVTRSFGGGRTATLAVGDLWRWGMQDVGTQSDLKQFWRQVSRWLVKDNPNQVELNAVENSESGITLTASARDEAFAPLQSGSAKVFVTQLSDGQESLENATELELNLRPVTGKTGLFSTNLPIDDSGAFHAKVQVYHQDGSLLGEAETGWVNQPLVSEFSSLSPNREYLQSLAQATGGQIVELNEIESIVNSIAQLPAPHMEIWSEPLWHNQWLFLLALACFLLEWLLRRKRGLA